MSLASNLKQFTHVEIYGGGRVLDSFVDISLHNCCV